MARQEIGAEHDDSNLNNINSNFIELYADISTATGTKQRLDAFLNGTGVVTNAMLADGSVDGNKIGEATIFSPHLRLGAIGERELATGGVSSPKIRNGAVNETKIEDGSVTRSKIAGLSVDTSKLGTASVTEDKIGPHAVNQYKLAPESVTESKYSKNSVSNRALAFRAVNTENLEDEAVTGSKIGKRAVLKHNLGLRSVGVRNTDFMTELRENLFIPQNIINSMVVNYSTGLLSSNSEYVTSEDISVEPNTEYALSQIYYLVFKDIQGNVIGDVVTSPIASLNTVTSPNNAATVQFSIKKEDFPDLNAFVFLRGSSYTLRSYSRTVNHLKPETGSVSWSSTDFMIKSGDKTVANVFTNFNRSEKGWMVQTTNGTFVSTQYTEDYYHTDYIPVKPSSVIMRKHQRHIVYYDKNKIYITGNAAPNEITMEGITGYGEYTPSNAAYVVLNMRGDEELDEHLYMFNNDDSSLKIPELVIESHQIKDAASLVSKDNVLYGKTGVAFGDSITQNGEYPDYISARTGADYINVGFGSTRLARVDRPDYPWSKIGMCELTDAITTGDWTATDATIAEIDAYYGNTTYSTIYNRLKAIDFNTVDYLTFMYGTNDANNSVFEIGAADSADTYTVNGALNHIFQSIMSKYPHIKVYALSPIFRQTLSGWGDGDSDNSKLPDGVYLYDIAQAIVDRAKTYHTPSKDMYNESGINRHNASYFLKDGVHPGTEGVKLMNDIIYKFLLSY